MRTNAIHRGILTIGFFGVVLSSVPASAHHAAAAVFTDEVIEIEGYVTDFNFTNPHISIYLDVIDETGDAARWLATGPAVPGLRRDGWSEDTVDEGQYLRISGRKGRNDRPMVLMLIPGHAVVELDPTDRSILRVLTDTNVSNRSLAEAAGLSLQLPDGRPNLTGTWFGGLTAFIEDRRNPPLNERGRALQAEFDPIDDPVFAKCSNEPGLVRQAASILPTRIIQFDDFVLIEYEGYGGSREIYLDGRGPETDEHTRFGHHVARYEGDALVIETTQLLGNLTGPDGNALSDQTTTVETYRRVDTQTTGPATEMTLIVTDPGHLSGPWRIVTRKGPADAGYEFTEVECQLPLLGPAERQAHIRQEP